MIKTPPAEKWVEWRRNGWNSEELDICLLRYVHFLYEKKKTTSPNGATVLVRTSPSFHEVQTPKLKALVVP
jgi:hypothetical protein